MGSKFALEFVNLGIVAACLGVLAVLWRKRLARTFPAVTALLVLRVTYVCLLIVVLYHHKRLGISKHIAYDTYFIAFWCSFFLETSLFIAVIHGVYRMAMKPLEGLRGAAKIIFRWVAVVSLLLSASLVIGPSMGGASGYQVISERIQQGVSVITLCLLVFVCFAIKPLGLTFRSRIFGVSLGLGIWASTNLVEAAWYSTGGSSLHSPLYLVSAGGCFCAMLVWALYFVMPEPERKMILLPTTSPFFLWNSVSKALGDAPGFVAVAGFRPEMMEPAELQVLTAASNMARERQRREALEAQQSVSSMAQRVALHSIAMPR